MDLHRLFTKMANLLSWTKEQIEDHIKAAQKLGKIKDEVKSFLISQKNISEKEIISFIKKAYKKYGLINDSKKEFCIVAYGKNTSHVHYFPSPTSNLKLSTENLILLDIWARLDKKNAPYADMTWMFYCGKKTPRTIENVWKALVMSRNAALQFLVKKLKRGIIPRGLDIDRVAHDIIGKAGFGKNIQHTVGHSLGLKHPHGDLPGINWREYSPILKNVGYTIEPGIYFKDKFGLRTEIDFYISKENKIIVTTPIQKNIEIV